MINAGFSEKEARLYISLLEIGEATVDECAKVSGVRRTTAYQLMKKLVEKGFVAEIIGKPLRYSCLPPKEAFSTFLSNKIGETKLRYEEDIKKMNEELHSISNSNKFIKQAEEFYQKYSTTSINDSELVVLRGPAAAENINRHLYLKLRECARVISKFPIQFSLSSNEIERRIEYIKKERAAGVPEEPPVLILFESDMLKNKEFAMVLKFKIFDNHKIRHLPSLPVKIIIYDDYACIVDIKHNKKPENWTRLLIQNKEFVKYQIIAFDALWEKATPIQLEDIEKILEET